MDEKEKLLIPSVGKYNIESTNVSPKKMYSFNKTLRFS